MGTRLLVIFLCLGVLSTVPGCYVAPTSSGTSASGGGTEDETRSYRTPWGRQDGGTLSSVGTPELRSKRQRVEEQPRARLQRQGGLPSHRNDQIPPDFVVKTQALDIAEVIL